MKWYILLSTSQRYFTSLINFKIMLEVNKITSIFLSGREYKLRFFLQQSLKKTNLKWILLSFSVSSITIQAAFITVCYCMSPLQTLNKLLPVSTFFGSENALKFPPSFLKKTATGCLFRRCSCIYCDQLIPSF